MVIGSEEHKVRFCRFFIDTHVPFQPADLPWPELDEKTIQKLSAFPIWDHAIHTERQVFNKLLAYSKEETDPLLKEALALQAYEEGRHANILKYFLQRYNIPFKEEPDDPLPDNLERGFMITGAGECIDSFFGFGFLQMAKNAGEIPIKLIEAMEPVMQEEARHILFIKNWLHYQRHRRPLFLQPVHAVMTLVAFATAGMRRLMELRKVGGASFTIQAREIEKSASLSPKEFITICLQENKRRLAPYDQDLLRPKLVPRLMNVVRGFL